MLYIDDISIDSMYTYGERERERERKMEGQRQGERGLQRKRRIHRAMDYAMEVIDVLTHDPRIHVLWIS